MADAGKLFKDIFGFDPTPGFNLSYTTQGGNFQPRITGSGGNARTGDMGGKSNKKAETPAGKPITPMAFQPSQQPAAVDPAAAAEAAEAARVATLRGDIQGRRNAVLAAYEALFGDIDQLAKSQAGEIEKKAGQNINELTQSYTSSIPQIQSSYSAVGAGDSTDTRDAKITAKTGYDKSVSEVGENKSDDLAKVGQYVNENKANWMADKDSILRLIGRVGETEDVGDLNEARNTVENKLGTLGATRATLGTEQGARGKLSEITDDGGRFAAIKDSLDNIVNSSLSGGVKAAAVQAVSDSAGLTSEDKQKIKQMYGDVYNAPVA